MTSSMENNPQRILLIEDNPADVALTKAEFDDLNGFELTTVSDLGAGIRKLNEISFDCVLLDLNLPDADGLSGLERLAASNPDLPVVVLSGFGADDLLLAREAVRMGAQDFMAKGTISAPELERTIQLAVERKSLESHRVRWSRHDPGTGLPNKLLMQERFPRAVSRCERTGTYLAVLVVKISGLENIRVEHGLPVQEAALKTATHIILENVRRNDTVGFIDEGTLVVMAECMRNTSDAYAVARKLLAQFTGSLRVDDKLLDMWLSIGVAHRATANSDFDGLMSEATDAVIRAQSAGGRCYKGPIDQAA